MKNKKSIIIGITSLFLVTLILLGLTYAYYRTRIIGNNSEEPSISVQSKTLEVSYKDGKSTLSTTGLISPGFEATKEFSVENTGDAIAKYSLKIDNVQNDFLRDEDWTYELYLIESDGSENLLVEDNLPIYDFYLDGSVSIDVDAVHSYKLVVKYANLTSEDQSIDMGASLSFRVTIDNETSLDTVEMKASDLLALANGDTITLNKNVILTDYLRINNDSNITTLDLNNHILTVKGEKEPYDTAYAHITVYKDFEIKNGVIKRHVASNASDYSAERGSLVYALGSNTNLTISDVVLDGENINLITQDGARGAAIYANDISSLTINSSIICNNKRESGVWMGGIYALRVGDFTMNDSKVINNSSPRAAAIHVEYSDNVKIINSQFNNNISKEIGIVNVTNVNVGVIFDKNSIIKNNKAGEAAGLRLSDVNNAVIAGTIENNETTLSDGNGGGLYLHLSGDSQVATIESTAKIVNNIAGGAGGGIYVNSKADSETTEVGSVIMNGGLVSGNIAKGTPVAGTFKDGGGAGIYVARGKMTINGGTIENNTSTSGIGNAIIVSNAGKKANGGILQINDGTILGSIEVAENYGTLTISGGTYSFDVSKYLTSGLSVTQSDDKYIVG